MGDLQNDKTYTSPKAYGDTKLVNLLLTTELQRRYGPQGITAVAFHPGNVATNFASDTTHCIRFLYRTPLSRLIISPKRGGQHLTWLAAGTPGVTWTPGAYYENDKVARSHPQVSDAELAKQLWEHNAALLNLAK